MWLNTFVDDIIIETVRKKFLRQAAPLTQKNSNQTRSNQIKCPCLVDGTVLGGRESMARKIQREHTWKPRITCSLFWHNPKYLVGVVNAWQAGSDTSNSILHSRLWI